MDSSDSSDSMDSMDSMDSTDSMEAIRLEIGVAGFLSEVSKDFEVEVLLVVLIW